jgi:hypothetical protein
VTPEAHIALTMSERARLTKALRAYRNFTVGQCSRAIKEYALRADATAEEIALVAKEMMTAIPDRRVAIEEIQKRAGLKSWKSCETLLFREKVNIYIQEEVEAFINRRIDNRDANRKRLSHGRVAENKPKKYRDVIWQPDALATEPPQEGPQHEFLTSSEDIVLMEGGKGSGKTDLLIFDDMRPERLDNPVFHSVIFRREYKRLVEVIDRAHYWYGRLPALHAHWQGGESRFIFPSGAWVAFHNVEHLEDEKKYQGWQISSLKFDQLEEFAETQFDYLMLQNRSGDLKLRSTVRATANPLGVGHAWIKRRFIDKLNPSETHIVEKTIDGVTYSRTFRRIHTTVLDNPLLKHDKKYIATLATDPNPIRRKAMFKGDWNVVMGQFFDSFMTDIHVIPVRVLPSTWKRAAGLDYGNVKVMEFLACDYEGNVYVENEFRLEPNVEHPNGYTAQDFGEQSAEFMLERNIGENMTVVADVNMWTATGRDVGSDKVPAFMVQKIWRDKFKAKDKRPPVLIPVSKKGTEEHRYRIACNEAMRSYLGFKMDEQGNLTQPPRIYFMGDQCPSLVQTLPALQADPNDPMDIKDGLDDHDFDACKMPFMQLFAAKSATGMPLTAEEKWKLQNQESLKKSGLVTLSDAVASDWRTDW